MTMFTAANTIFMGLPVNMAVFGEKQSLMRSFIISVIPHSFSQLELC